MAAQIGPNNVHDVLIACGVNMVAAHNNIIQNEGFNSLDDIALLDNDFDVTEMAKRMASRCANNGQVNLGTTVIKRFQALVWWLKDQIQLGTIPVAADFTNVALLKAIQDKTLEKELVEKSESSLSSLGTFDPDEIETHDEAFLNFLSMKIGVQRESLRYVVRPNVVPDVFADAREQRLFQIPLQGSAFNADNRTVYQNLKLFFADTPGYARIENYDSREDGRQAYLS
jgi:hypothetical protein